MQIAFYLNWAENFFVPNYEDWKVCPFETPSHVGGAYAVQSNVTSQDFKGLGLVKKNHFLKKVLIACLDNNLT